MGETEPPGPADPSLCGLGRGLFFEKRLSADGTVSCATCHQPASGWADGRRLSVGIGGRLARRHTPTLYNVREVRHLFWDGRAASLEEQVLVPIEDANEMGHDLDALVDWLRASAGYRGRFAEAGVGLNRHGVASALAAFCRSIVAEDAPLDRYRRGDAAALSPPARRGHDLFYFRLSCATCHTGPQLTDGLFHNTGVGFDHESPDLGRYGVSGRDADRGAFRTPTLRNLSETAPYMHDGRFRTLEEVIDFYAEGGIMNPHLDPMINLLPIDEAERADLVAFLTEGLTSPTDPAAEAARREGYPVAESEDGAARRDH